MVVETHDGGPFSVAAARRRRHRAEESACATGSSRRSAKVNHRHQRDQEASLEEGRRSVDASRP